MEIGTLAQWAGATATLIAVVVALFKEDLARRWRSPKLSAVIRLRAPDCNKTPFFITTGAVDHGTMYQKTVSFDCYYFRIWIGNTGNQRAERVQVYAVRLLKKLLDSSDRGAPVELHWNKEVIVDALIEKLDARLREWKPETAAQVRVRVAEVIDLADHDVLDLVRSRAIEQEVLNLLDEPTTR
jgi:hypothetical protein